MRLVSNPSGEGGAGWKPALQPEAAPAVLRMQVLGGNPTPPVVGREPLPGKVNYFLGNDPHQWRTNVSTYAKVEYQDVYPGINLDYYGHQGQLEYDFVVAPGADSRVIQLGFSGADQVRIDGQSDLVLHAGGQDLCQHKPVVYQEVNGTRQEIGSAFVLTSDPAARASQQIGFALGSYDVSRPLVIDPVLSYSTHLGSSGTDDGNGIAVDGAGNADVTGYTASTNFPTANAFQPTYGGGTYDAFVSNIKG